MGSYYRLQAEVDLDNAGRLRSDLLTLVDAGTGTLTIDCAHLASIDSIGVAVLGQIRRLLAVQGRELRIVNVRPQVRRPFERLGHSDYFQLSDTA